jgi:Transposase DDE domain
MVDPTELYCSVDDFWISFEEQWHATLLSQGSAVIPTRVPGLSLSEVMTIDLMFHLSGYRCFKHFYKGFILDYLHDLFPKSPSYQQFLELRKRIVFPLHCYLLTRMGVCTGISFIDSTALPVCNVRRIARHRLFKKAARRAEHYP